MPYSQLYYHIVWATKNREPLLDATVEAEIGDNIKAKASGLGGVVHALNGMPDHVHLVVSIPARISVAKFVGQVKGSASSRHNRLQRDGPMLYWQGEYAVFSLDRKRLPYHVRYVERQKQHHAEETTIGILERLGTAKDEHADP